MANQLSNKMKYLLATKAIDFANDTFKIILMSSNFVFNKDTHEKYSDVSASELATANGYTQFDKTLSGVSVTEDDTNDMCSVTWSNVSWTATGGPIGPSAGAIIIDDTLTDDPIIGFIDFGQSYTQQDGGVFSITSISLRIY